MNAISELAPGRILSTYTAESLADMAEALDWPTTGQFAVGLWELLSGNWGVYNYQRAAEIYRACGYIPFCGYPLARSGKFERQTPAGRVFWRNEARCLGLA